MSDPTTPTVDIDAATMKFLMALAMLVTDDVDVNQAIGAELLAYKNQTLVPLRTRAEAAEAIVQSVQAELLAGGSPARLRAIVGITKESSTNAERS